MRRRWPEGAPAQVVKQIEDELALIAELGYEAFFLTVEDIVRFAKERKILCQGRGSSANSAVCFALGITARSVENTSELQCLMRISYAVFGLEHKRRNPSSNLMLLLTRKYICLQ